MGYIAYELVKIKSSITEPKFTKDGLLMPEDYFRVYGEFHNAVCDELEALKFDKLMEVCKAQSIGPDDGFSRWIGEATLIVWITCLKIGYTGRAFYPKVVAAGLMETSQEMLSDVLLNRLNDVDSLTKH